MMQSVIRLARVGSGVELAAAAVLGLAYPVLALAAFLPAPWIFLIACCASYAAERVLHQRRSYLLNRLGAVQAGLAHRFLIRQVLLVLLVARTSTHDASPVHVLLGSLLLFHGLQVLHAAVATLVRLRRKMPLSTRNIDLSAVGIHIPGAPPPLLLNRPRQKMAHLDVPLVAGTLATALTGAGGYGAAGACVTLAAAAAYTAALVPWLRPSRRPPRAQAVLAGVDEWLGDHRPETVLYFSGSKDSAYQVNMWLATMEQLPGRSLVLLRERAVLDRLAPTTLPVICVPGAVHLMEMDLSSVRVALYPANVGRNIHLLRVPTMKHVFIGHGDSDKTASVNPFSKVYDEVWTAGRAGRERYRLAGVGVSDTDIIEVGRPQLGPVQPWQGVAEDRVPTVLYAPTWEGWDDRPGNTSLVTAGENIVRLLLQSHPPVRLLYRPHPFTGIRSAQARAAHLRITAMIEAAAGRRATDPAWAAHAADDGRATARAELASLTARLTALTTAGEKARDEAESSRIAGGSTTDPGAAGELRKRRDEAYWRSVGRWQHRVITGDGPALYDCFNEADGLVADVSSVVSDFIASGKPYAVTDSAGLGTDRFRAQVTAARAAVILDTDATQLDDLVEAIKSKDTDPLAAARQELREFLLGPGRPGSAQRFNEAVRRLAAQSEARNRTAAEPLAPGTPGPQSWISCLRGTSVDRRVDFQGEFAPCRNERRTDDHPRSDCR